jgi:hypothetical protein
MGHQRLGKLPQSRKWRHVVELISGGAEVGDIAGAVSAADEQSMLDAANDPTVGAAFYLLTQIPLAARKEHFPSALRQLGMRLGDRLSLVEIVAALGDAVDRQVRAAEARNDWGEMVQMAAAESLSAVAGRDLPGLFATTPEDVQSALAGFATEKQFSVLARDFFARLTRHHLDYYLSRELSKHVGINSRFQTIREHQKFEEALDRHCRETARIVKEFSGEWFSKANYEGGIDAAKAGRFVHIAFKKIRSELRMRRGARA